MKMLFSYRIKLQSKHNFDKTNLYCESLVVLWNLTVHIAAANKICPLSAATAMTSSVRNIDYPKITDVSSFFRSEQNDLEKKR